MVQRTLSFVRRYDSALVALVAAILYVVTYVNHPAVPSAQSIGWFSWYDQSEYLRTAKDLAAFKFRYSVYPLGYPILGALFLWLLPLHPFFVPNLLCAVGITVLFYRIAASLVTRIEAFVLTALGVFMQSYLWVNTLTPPWNSVPVSLAILVCTYFIVFRKVTQRGLAICGVAIACAFLCRPWDALFLMMLFAAGLFELGTWRERIRATSTLAIGLFAGIALVAIDYLTVFGTLMSPYIKQHLDMGFSLFNYPLRLYQIVFDGNLIAEGVHPSVFAKMPYLCLILPGMALVIRRYGRRAVAWLVSMTAMIGFYLSMNGLTPSNFWSYHGYRYLTFIVPFVVMFAYLSLTRAWRLLGWKVTLAGLAAGVLVPVVVGEKVVAVDPGMPVAFSKKVEGKTLHVTLQLLQPAQLDGIRMQFDRSFSIPIDTSISPADRVMLEENGQPESVFHDFVVEQEPNGTATIVFPQSVRAPISRVDATFNGIDNDSLSAVTPIKAEFQPFGYFVHVLHVLNRLRLNFQIRARLVSTPWDLTGSAAGIPDGQLDFAIDCDFPTAEKEGLTDLEIRVGAGNLTGKWATHNRGMNWDKLAFARGYVEDAMKTHHPPQLIGLTEILKSSGKFTILFKLPESYRKVPLTLVGLDRQGQELFEKQIAPLS